MNYTNRHRLPQWEKSDRILMDDFNQAMKNIEDGLDQTARDAAENSNSAAQTAAQAVADAARAQSTADSALSAANAAYRPGSYPYAAGVYRGLGDGYTVNVTVGFCPSVVLIAGKDISVSTANYGNVYMCGGSLPNACITCTAAGFSISTAGMQNPPPINGANQSYAYIAFR